jgi:hypothetical protein
MDEPTCLPGARWGHLRWLLLLVVLAAAMRVWQVSHTEVTTRDSIAFIRYAWRLHTEPWGEIIRDEEHHPGYPFLVYLADGPARALVPDDLPRAMQLAAQLVSCLASVLLVVPMYFLGCEWFERRVGFWATLLLQCLPATGRLMPDGLTEPLFLLLASSALLFASRAVRGGGPGWFVLTGLASGLAYLTRTEGLLIAAVTGLVLAGLQMGRTWRRDRQAFLKAGLALTVATLLVAGPFMWHIKGLSLKPGVRGVMGQPTHQASGGGAPAGPPRRDEPGGSLAHAGLPLAVWMYGEGMEAKDRYGWAAYALAAMTDKTFFHVLTWPALLGLWLFRRRAAKVPGLWVLFGLWAALVPLLYRLGQANGYLGERHVLLLVLGGLYFAVAALAVLAARLGRLGSPVALLVLMGLALFPLGKTLAPLHPERAGFRQAGRWLALHAKAEDEVIDPFGWARYHSGRFLPSRRADPTRVHYVVLDRSRSTHDHLWYLVGPAEKLAALGVEVRRFEVRAGKYRSTVLVVRVAPAVPTRTEPRFVVAPPLRGG